VLEFVGLAEEPDSGEEESRVESSATAWWERVLQFLGIWPSGNRAGKSGARSELLEPGQGLTVGISAGVLVAMVACKQFCQGADLGTVLRTAGAFAGPAAFFGLVMRGADPEASELCCGGAVGVTIWLVLQWALGIPPLL
jgi:hypothetical protein